MTVGSILWNHHTPVTLSIHFPIRMQNHLQRCTGRYLLPVLLGALATLVTLPLPGCDQVRTSDWNLRLVDVDGARRLTSDDRIAFVDPRTQSEYEARHIPGAIHLPYQDVLDEYKKLNAYRTVVVYGTDFNDPKALGMSKRLIELGQGDVRTLEGGLRSWEAAGEPVDGTEADGDAASDDAPES